MNLDVLNTTWKCAVDACLAVVNLPGARELIVDSNFARLAEQNLTVRIKAGMRNGLTTFIARNATNHDLIIVPNADALRYLQRALLPKATVLPVSMIKGGMPTYKRIWVDCASILPSSDIRAIYQATARNVEQRWFLLG